MDTLRGKERCCGLPLCRHHQGLDSEEQRGHIYSYSHTSYLIPFQPSQPTTTLQALVNLKRPTLRLVPLTIAAGDDPDQADSHHHHGLEFEYDCDAPKCKINVNVILPVNHPLAENVDSRGFSRILVFQSVVDGGFGKFLKLDQDATLELGRFEQSVCPEDVASDQPSAYAQATGPATATPQNGHQRRRFTAFRFRKSFGDRAASGPALTVVDADAASTSVESEKDKGSKDDMQEGIRATIRLSALDEEGMDVPTVNEQTTYLHIVRVGTPLAADEEDTRPWVVKVIKREATVSVYYSLSNDLTQSCRLARTHSISTKSTVLPPSRLPQPTLMLLLPQVQTLIPIHLHQVFLRLQLAMRTNLLQSVCSVCLRLARSSSFRAVTLWLARNVQSTWLNLAREATLYIMVTRTLVGMLLPDRGLVAQRTRAACPRGPVRRLSPLRTRVENVRLRGGSVLFADNVSIFLFSLFQV